MWVRILLINSYQLMMDCWKEDPDERPTFTQLISIMEEMMTADAPYYDLSKTDESQACYSPTAGASTSRAVLVTDTSNTVESETNV